VVVTNLQFANGSSSFSFTPDPGAGTNNLNNATLGIQFIMSFQVTNRNKYNLDVSEININVR
jgi:hypothetical protein